ncbi:MAG: sigma-70 family RNA polymerase sigma factor [Chitinophagales bacterium]
MAAGANGVAPAEVRERPETCPPGESELGRLVRQAHQGDQGARDELVKRNLRLVGSVVRRFLGSMVEEEDLFQIGCIGLVKAVDRFDPGRGLAFSTYAVPYITGEILSHLRRDRPVKVSRATQERARQVRRLREQLAQRLGREPSLAEVAREAGLAEDAVVAALDACQAVVSLEAPLVEGEGEELHRGDVLAAPAEDQLEKMALMEGLKRLPDLERRLVELRFFGHRTQAEAGRLLGLSQVQACRVEKRALERLRRAMA